MGVLITSDGKEVYFQESSYRKSLHDNQYSLDLVKPGDQVIFKAKEIAISVLRPIAFYRS
jgi:hypothetical protein